MTRLFSGEAAGGTACSPVSPSGASQPRPRGKPSALRNSSVSSLCWISPVLYPGDQIRIFICRCCTHRKEMSKSWVSCNCCSLSQFQLLGVSHTAPSPCTTCNSIIERYMFSAKHSPEMQANSFIWHSTENAPLCSKALENSR